MDKINLNLSQLNIVLIMLIAVVTLLSLVTWSWHMPGMMGFWIGWGCGPMFLLPLVFLALVGLGVYFLISGFTGQHRSKPADDQRALEALKERYAKGEISREQYIKMRDELEL